VVVESVDPAIAEHAGPWVATILAAYVSGAVPIVRRTLPRTETGKVRRIDLRDALVAGL
jgi:acyl-coenzyme A synthetase/AMP-(fatty) acid ligase